MAWGVVALFRKRWQDRQAGYDMTPVTIVEEATSPCLRLSSFACRYPRDLLRHHHQTSSSSFFTRNNSSTFSILQFDLSSDN
jgi:hypothetical protein